jgi:hypothetical protein
LWEGEDDNDDHQIMHRLHFYRAVIRSAFLSRFTATIVQENLGKSLKSSISSIKLSSRGNFE